MTRFLKATILLFFVCLNSAAVAYYAQDFTEAKKIARIVWSENRETFYCGCHYDRHGNIDYKSCSYLPVDKRKSKRISWEHVVPASWYGKTLDCWTHGQCIKNNGKTYTGRDCCRKVDPKFREMEADLHNLVPAIRELNIQRQNYPYAELSALHKTCEANTQNCCHFYVDTKRQLAEPRDEVKGMAARITLYMAKKYNIPLDSNEKHLLNEWNVRFAPSRWERRWHQQVSAIQGDVNPFIQNYDNNKNRG